MDKLIWKTIPGYHGHYQASNQGHIREQLDDGTYRCVKQRYTTDGYLSVVLKYGKPSWTSVHRCVAKAFLPNPDNLSDVDHIASNITNNNVSNLEWVSHSENCRRHRLKHPHYSRTAVKCIETGEIFTSMAEASRAKGIRYESVLGSIYMNRSVKGYTFRRIESL